MAYLITGLYCFCLAFLVASALFIYFKNSKSWLNRYFLLLSVSIFAWLLTLYFFDRQADSSLLTLLGRANFTSAAFIVLFNYLFTPQVVGERSKWTWLLVAETVILAGLTQFTGLIDHSEHLKDGQHITQFGPLFPFYIVHIVVYVLVALYLTFFAYRKVKAAVRSQLNIIGFGVFLMAGIAIFTNIILPYGYNFFDFQEVGALSTTFFLLAIAYAISAHHLFDIRVIIKRTVIYTGLLIFALLTYSMVIFFFTNLFGGNGSAFDTRNFLVNLLAAGLIAVGYDPLRRTLEDKTDSFLFKKEYEEQAVLNELGRKLNDVVALDEALDLMMQTIVKVFHLHHAVTFVFQPAENSEVAIKRIKQIGYTSMNHVYLNDDDFTISYFSSHPGVTRLDVLNQETEEEKRRFSNLSNGNTKSLPKETSHLIRQHAIKVAVAKKLTDLSAALAIPLHLNQQPIGLILLSDKLSGDTFSPEDVTLLDTMATQAISSIQKAKLYEGDQMKSEFVSIASHELLTPVSAMEGYLSMILDENMGKVDAQARNYLDKVYISSKRLSALVKDLLSVSRIEAGRMKMEPQSLDMNKLIHDTMDQLKFLAENKKLKMTYKAADKALPPVWADSDRTMQVLVNLVSNAIKYTPKGDIVITASHSLQPTPHVQVSVTDTGLGISKAAQAHLFEKFYRVATPQTTGIVGTGLGLYITKSIIEMMGGVMTLKSTEGKGSTFSFTLPTFKVEKSRPE
ncbi:MAG: ATP-binding protein [bacterium]